MEGKQMKIKKIVIDIPKAKDGIWEFIWGRGGRPTKRRDATLLYKAIERRLLRTPIREKTAIVVKGYVDKGLEILNETCDSCNPNYLLFCLACFLEDNLEYRFLQAKYKYKDLGQNP